MNSTPKVPPTATLCLCLPPSLSCRVAPVHTHRYDERYSYQWFHKHHPSIPLVSSESTSCNSQRGVNVVDQNISEWDDVRATAQNAALPPGAPTFAVVRVESRAFIQMLHISPKFLNHLRSY